MRTEMNKCINNLSAGVPRDDDEYLGPDGLIYCRRCGNPRELIINAMGITKTVRCICPCQKAKRDAEASRSRRDAYDVERRKCFLNVNDEMRYWTFENDDGKTPTWSEPMMRYADNFADFKSKNKGLLLYGNVGTGKTYMAAAIANRVIDNGYRAKLRTFKGIEAEYFNAKNKVQFMDDLNRCDLLIFDDLGVERESGFMNELVFNVINTRCVTGLPFICTTNLTGEELNSPDNIKNARIYDRILGQCYPFKMEGPSRRKQRLKETITETQMMLGL